MNPIFFSNQFFQKWCKLGISFKVWGIEKLYLNFVIEPNLIQIFSTVSNMLIIRFLIGDNHRLSKNQTIGFFEKSRQIILKISLNYMYFAKAYELEKVILNFFVSNLLFWTTVKNP